MKREMTSSIQHQFNVAFVPDFQSQLSDGAQRFSIARIRRYLYPMAGGAVLTVVLPSMLLSA